MDIYNDGDNAGIELHIFNSGKAILYNLLIQDTVNKRQFNQVFSAMFHLSPNTFKELQSLFIDYDFYSWPNLLPAESPHNIQMRTPAPSVKMTCCSGSKKHVVNVHLGSDKTYYPDGFFEIRSYIANIIEKIY